MKQMEGLLTCRGFYNRLVLLMQVVVRPSWSVLGPPGAETVGYRRMRLHAGGVLVVWPGMLFPKSRGY